MLYNHVFSARGFNRSSMAIIPSDQHANSGPRQSADSRPERLVQPEKRSEDQHELSLRPNCLADYLGQAELKQSLAIAVSAARKRQEALDHILFYGPPGLGKTTLSMLIAAEMGTQIRITSAPALERPRDIAGLLVALQPGDVLFIDEIHRLNKIAEEILYPAMEDFMLDITLGKGQAARIKRLPLKRFTLIGATTRAGTISSPLRTRFGLVQRLRFYTEAEMQAILMQSAGVLKVSLLPAGAEVLAQRSRGTPRVGNRLLKWVRDYAQVHEAEAIDASIAVAALEMLQIDAAGLDPVDRQILSTIITHYQGGPVGLDTLAAAISEDAVTIEDMIEPFLMQQGFLQRTSRGRVATALAARHLGLPEPRPANSQLPLFEHPD